MRHIQSHGLLIDGHDVGTVDQAVDTAAAWYQTKGKSGLDQDKAAAIAKASAAVQQAWYCDEFGFVQEDHPQAQPVTIVAMYVGEQIQ